MKAVAMKDPILRRLRAGLDRAYGDRIERVVLFGSRARGDNRADSDYDVAIFIRDMHDWWSEVRHLVDISYDSLGDAATQISAKPFLAGTMVQRTPLMHEIRRDGVEF